MKKLFTPIVLFYLRFWASLQLKKIKPVIIGVGGASGKSSVSLLIYQILSSKFSVKQSKGKNSETGIPLNILDLELTNYGFLDWLRVLVLCPVAFLTNFKHYDFFVAEMGIDSPFPPKNMEYLLRLIKPDIGVLTNIDLEHSVYFDSLVKDEDDGERKKKILEITAKEEGLLLKSLGETDRSVVNLDDPNISNLLPLKSRAVTVSMKDKNANFYVQKISISRDSFEVDFISLGEEYQLKINQPLPEYFAYSFVLSIVVCFNAGVNIKDSINTLADNFSLPPGRFSVFSGIKNSIIIDSSYNSSLSAAEGALEAMKDIGEDRRKVGILGDMRELGSLTEIAHEELAKTILKTLDFAILIGPAVSQFAVPILEKEKFSYLVFDSFANAKKSLTENVQRDDLILVKGSQNTLFLERAVEILLKNKKDADKLCRRGNFWDKKRKENQ